MSRQPRLSLAILLALFVCPALFAGNGGGHGGGGHSGGGHGGGHSGGAGSSGHSHGHSGGHSFGRLFGRGSSGRDSRIGKKSAGNSDVFVSGVAASFARGRVRHRRFLRNRQRYSGYCGSFRFSWRNFVCPGEFDCYGNPFLTDPFFYGASLGTYFWSDSLAASQDFGDSPELPTSPEEPETAPPSLWNVEEPVAMLQLLDGSTYGLLRYWVVGTTLHYVTNYGGENSVPLERVDFAATEKLNAAKGTRFDLTGNTPPQP